MIFSKFLEKLPFRFTESYKWVNGYELKKKGGHKLLIRDMIDINKLISEAMKSKNTVALNAYKNLKAEIQLAKTAKNAKPYDDVMENSVILKYCKKLGDAVTEFKEAGRDDLVKDYENELSVLSTLLPKVPNDAEILECVREWMAGAEFIPQKSFGQVMKYVKTKLPLADGSSVSRIVKGFIREA